MCDFPQGMSKVQSNLNRRSIKYFLPYYNNNMFWDNKKKIILYTSQLYYYLN